MTAATTATATLFCPRVRYTSTGESQFDAMMTWRADLELSYLDDEGDEGDAPDVVGGYAEFLVMNVGEHQLGDLLDSLSQDTAHFAGLFEDEEVAQGVRDQFDDQWFNRVLIVTLVDVAAPLRGHGLGAWLVAEVIARMASVTDTLVLLYPAPVGSEKNSAAELAGAPALSRYWQQRVGLVPIDQKPEILGAATAYSHVSNARAALQVVGNAQITVSRSLIGVEQRDGPRHAFSAAPELPGLRLVRD